MTPSDVYEYLTSELNSPITVLFPIYKASALNRIFFVQDRTVYELILNRSSPTIQLFHFL